MGWRLVGDFSVFWTGIMEQNEARIVQNIIAYWICILR